jgi:hypothetical protein
MRMRASGAEAKELAQEGSSSSTRRRGGSGKGMRKWKLKHRGSKTLRWWRKVIR